MWTTLVSVIQQNNRDKKLEQFLARIRREGICVLEIEPEQIYRLPGEKSPRQPFVGQETLLLTDMPEVATEAKNRKIAAIGLEWKGGSTIPQVSYVAQDLDGIDAGYLRMVYQRFHHEPLTIAQTRRLCIRELVCDEASLFWELCQEAGLKDMSKETSQKEKEKFLEAYIRCQYALFGYGIWAITDKTSEEMIGIAGIEDREKDKESYGELGYAVIPSRRRQGYAKEACEAILQYMEQELGWKGKIKCFVPKGNPASRYTAQSIGMLQTEDIFDEFYCYVRII